MNRILLALAFALLGAGTAAAADSPCRGQAPLAGIEVRGPVLHVLDGRTLCVATGADTSLWAQVTLADAPPAASWGGLMSVAFGKDVVCMTRDAQGAAVCRLGGRSLGEELGRSDIEKAGLAWKAPANPAAATTSIRTLRVADASS